MKPSALPSWVDWTENRKCSSLKNERESRPPANGKLPSASFSTLGLLLSRTRIQEQAESQAETGPDWPAPENAADGSALRPGSGRIELEARALWTHRCWKRNETGPGGSNWTPSTPFLGQDLPIAAQHAAMARVRARGTRVPSTATLQRCVRDPVAPGSTPRQWAPGVGLRRPQAGSRWEVCAGNVQVRERRPPWSFYPDGAARMPASVAGGRARERGGVVENHPPSPILSRLSSSHHQRVTLYLQLSLRGVQPQPFF